MAETSSALCAHSEPAPYGASSVHWANRGSGIGWVQAPCADCGESLSWTISTD